MAEPETSDTAPRIRLPSPGCLFALTLLVALVSVCGWVGWHVHRQQVRLEYFEQLGGRVETEPANPMWLHDLVASRLGEEQAAGFTDITRLALDDTQVTDADLHHLSGLKNLQELNLHNTQVTDAGLHHLSGLTNLQELNLGFTQVTDAGPQHVSGLPNLQVLRLYHTQVTEAGIAELKSQLPGVEINH